MEGVKSKVRLVEEEVLELLEWQRVIYLVDIKVIGYWGAMMFGEA